MNKSNSLSKILFLIFVAVGGTISASTVPTDPVNQLQNLNAVFRENYANQKNEILTKLPVIIIAKGDYLILYHKGSRTEVKYLPSAYHRHKEVSHIPVLLYLIVQDETNLSDSKLAELNELRKAIVHIQETLDNNAYADLEISNSKDILKRCLDFIDNKIHPNTKAVENQTVFFKKLGPLLLKNAAEASFLQLDALNTQVQAWKKEIPREDWNRIAVVVMGPQMPRVGEVTMQYFARLTGKQMEKGNSTADWLNQTPQLVNDPNKRQRRLVYAESLRTEEEALGLLATHIIDEDIGRIFFDDEMRMQCDLLSEGASKRLKEKCDHSEKNKAP